MKWLDKIFDWWDKLTWPTCDSCKAKVPKVAQVKTFAGNGYYACDECLKNVWFV